LFPPGPAWNIRISKDLRKGRHYTLLRWERGLSFHQLGPIEVPCLRAEIKGEQRISKDEHHKEDPDPVGSQRETARDNNPRQTHRGYCSRRIHPSSPPRRGSAQRAPVDFEDEDGNFPHKTGDQWEIQFSNRRPSQEIVLKPDSEHLPYRVVRKAMDEEPETEPCEEKEQDPQEERILSRNDSELPGQRSKSQPDDTDSCPLRQGEASVFTGQCLLGFSALPAQLVEKPRV